MFIETSPECNMKLFFENSDSNNLLLSVSFAHSIEPEFMNAEGITDL